MTPSFAVACRLALILALDVSSSIDENEHQLQRGGTAEALLAANVQDAFFASPEPVALAIFEWSGRNNQVPLLDWTLIEGPDDLVSAAQAVLVAARSYSDYPTALGHALGHASLQFKNAPTCTSQTIDVAGDGTNNDGFSPKQAYSAFPFKGITVNGLVIRDTDFFGDGDLIPFFENEVIRGPGAFIEVADGFEDYARALERKLVRELTSFAVVDLNQRQADQG